MPLINTRRMLLDAQKNRYAVGAFNVENMEMVQAVVAAAEELGAPAIIQTTPSTVKYGGGAMFAAMVRAAAENATAPIALHLDHGSSFELAAQGIRWGYNSVMIDGSALPFDENIALCGRVAAMTAPCGVTVEAELGVVGGKEDGAGGGADCYTDPMQAREFVRRTGVDSLAVSIGTAHGPYSGGAPRLDVQRLREIRCEVEVPLVLHGASGLSHEQVLECIGEGICKVNFATELRIAYSDGVKELLAEKPGAYDPKAYGARGRQKVTELVKKWINVCACSIDKGVIA